MKNTLIILIALAFASIAFAQSVVIKDSADEPLLTINDEGTDQSSIGIPDAGSAFTGTDDKLYNIGSSLYWGGDKIALTGSADGDWTIDANNMYSTVSGNVGIGNKAPETKLHVTTAGSEIARFESSAGSNWISFYNGTTKQGSVWNNNGTMTFRSETGPVKFQTNGNNDRMYIKTTGEVGIGTTSPGAALDVSGTTSIFGSGNPRHLMLIKADGVTDNPGARLELEGTDGYPKQSFENWAGALRIFNDADITAQFGANGGLYLGTAPTTNNFPGAGNLIVDGDVGIGITTPEAEFHLFTGTGNFTGTHNTTVKAIIEDNSQAFLEFNAASWSGITFADDGISVRSGVLFNHVDDYISLYSAGSDRLVVEEFGNVGIGTTDPDTELVVEGSSTSYHVARFVNTGTGSSTDGIRVILGRSLPGTDNCYVDFKRNGGASFAGYITGNVAGTGVLYSSASDARLKMNITEYQPNAVAKVSEIKVREYEMKDAPGIRQTGFLAQELLEIYPQAVSGDPTNDVQTEPMGIDYGRITPLLVKAIQELQARIEVLEND